MPRPHPTRRHRHLRPPRYGRERHLALGGVERRRFELYALAASIVGKCHFCIQSHYKLLRESGMTATQMRDVGRIAAVVSATAQVLAAEGV